MDRRVKPIVNHSNGIENNSRLERIEPDTSGPDELMLLLNRATQVEEDELLKLFNSGW